MKTPQKRAKNTSDISEHTACGKRAEKGQQRAKKERATPESERRISEMAAFLGLEIRT